MKIKNQNSKENDQNSLPRKEVQRFLNKVEGVMLIPKNKIMEHPILCLLLCESSFLNFRDYNIRQTVLNLLDEKYPILSIRLDDDRNFVGLSIIDKESGLKFILPDQPVGKALLTFLEARKYDDKICLMIGFFKGGNIVFDPTQEDNILVILDGYIFE